MKTNRNTKRKAKTARTARTRKADEKGGADAWWNRLPKEAKETAMGVLDLLGMMKFSEACVISKRRSKRVTIFVFEDPREYLLGLQRKMDKEKGRA